MTPDDDTLQEPRALALARATTAGFRRALDETGLAFDAAQRAAVRAMEDPARGGFYLWGPVGRGKSMLAEAYFAAIPHAGKRRFHFHTFFRELQEVRFAEGGPIDDTIARMIGDARAVMFDEFHVHDVADAVYLNAALRGLFARDVLFLATSNYDPPSLLPHPEFHHRFAEGAALVRSHLDVVPLGDGQDYRLRAGPRPASGFASGSWAIEPAPLPVPSPGPVLQVNGLAIRALSSQGRMASFAFDEICGRPLGIREYLGLAGDLDALALRGVPDLANARRDELMRFANLVDALHDADVALSVTSAAAAERALAASEPPIDLARTLSRLALLGRG